MGLTVTVEFAVKERDLVFPGDTECVRVPVVENVCDADVEIVAVVDGENEFEPVCDTENEVVAVDDTVIDVERVNEVLTVAEGDSEALETTDVDTERDGVKETVEDSVVDPEDDIV